MSKKQPEEPIGAEPRDPTGLRDTDEFTPPPARVRRLPYVVYLAGIAIVVTAFLLEISRGQCPVP